MLFCMLVRKNSITFYLNALILDPYYCCSLLRSSVIWPEATSEATSSDEALDTGALGKFLDRLMQEYMTDPVFLPTSGNIADCKTITQRFLNDNI